MNIDEIINNTALIQAEKEKFIEMIRDNSKGNMLSLDTIKEMFFMLKISELQEEIKDLKYNKTIEFNQN